MMNLNRGLKGETPLSDYSGLRLSWVRTISDRDEAEVANMSMPTRKYLSAPPSRRTAPFTVRWMLKLHREMLGDVWKWAGKIRTVDLTLGIDWWMIESALENLARDVAFWRECENGDLIQEAAMLHHRAVQIHPFSDGNGRWSRLLAEIWLRQHLHSGIDWPENAMSRESPIRQEYIAAVITADMGDLDPLIELHRRLTRK